MSADHTPVPVIERRSLGLPLATSGWRRLLVFLVAVAVTVGIYEFLRSAAAQSGATARSPASSLAAELFFSEDAVLFGGARLMSGGTSVTQQDREYWLRTFLLRDAMIEEVANRKEIQKLSVLRNASVPRRVLKENLQISFPVAWVVRVEFSEGSPQERALIVNGFVSVITGEILDRAKTELQNVLSEVDEARAQIRGKLNEKRRQQERLEHRIARDRTTPMNSAALARFEDRLVDRMFELKLEQLETRALLASLKENGATEGDELNELKVKDRAAELELVELDLQLSPRSSESIGFQIEQVELKEEIRQMEQIQSRLMEQSEEIRRMINRRPVVEVIREATADVQ